MVGDYEIDETQVKFGKLAGTMMACPDLGGRDQQFRQALAKARGYRLLGPELQLRDADGGLLARFVAVPRPVAARVK
jgi:copper homeostasis protein (lipoprotein)